MDKHDDPVVNELQIELGKLVDEFSTMISKREDYRSLLDKQIQTLVDNYFNQIKDIAVVSSVVAPFSLVLLDVEKLNINTVSLLFGFFILLGNIVLSYILLDKYIRSKDIETFRGELSWMNITDIENKINDETKQINERVDGIYEYTKEKQTVDKALGLGYLDINLQGTRSLLRKYNMWTINLFIFGTLLIAISTFINYFLYKIFYFSYLYFY